MSDWYLFDAFEGFRTSRNVMNCVKDLGAVASSTTLITDADHDSFQNNKTLLVLERFANNLLGANSSFTLFALITVRTLISFLL